MSMIGRVKRGKIGADRILDAMMVAMTIGKRRIEMMMSGRDDFLRCFSMV